MATMNGLLMRLPLLFVVDSVLKGTFLDFTVDLPLVDTVGISCKPNVSFSLGLQQKDDFPFYEMLVMTTWYIFLWNVVIVCVAVLFCSLTVITEVYGCVAGLVCLLLSLKCNAKFMENVPEESKLSTCYLFCVYFMYTLLQYFLGTAFYTICTATFEKKHTKLSHLLPKLSAEHMFLCFTFPVYLDLSLRSLDLDTFAMSSVSVLTYSLPVVILCTKSPYILFVIISNIPPSYRYVTMRIRQVGFDVFFMNLMESIKSGTLLRTFFFIRLTCHAVTSKALSQLIEVHGLSAESAITFSNAVASELLYDMCGTILSVISISSIITVLSGWCLRSIYNVIGANEEEDNVQPAVSGFLFVLLAMQTGMTSMPSDYRLQLLLQNCILLLVANQHFVQTVAADLVLKASTDDVPMKKHVRPMLPYFIILTFPFVVVVKLWEYPFRLSWLLAISAFTIELVIKSLTTLTLYILNMMHSHTNCLHDSLDDFVFYIKGICGCLEFTCGVFLFINGLYIFCFESGGIIRLTMMIIHFYSNIYLTGLKGWNSFKLRRSALGKINKLQIASQEQLDENDDICSICYQEMTEAVVIKCKHVFHKGCLLKWLTVQEKCPLCHSELGIDGSDHGHAI